MKTIKLNLADRFAILARIPGKGRLQVMAVATAIRKKLEVSSQDVADFKVEEIIDEETHQVSGVKWDSEVDTTREFTFDNKAEIAMLVSIVKQMDEAEEITPASLDMALEIQSWEGCCDEKVTEIIGAKDEEQAPQTGVEEMQ